MKTRLRAQKEQSILICKQEQQNKGNEYLFSECIRMEMPNAKQCAQCGFGPVDHFRCNNLYTHHGRDGINNACPNCNHFASKIDEWNLWDGKIDGKICSKHMIQIFVKMASGKTITLDIKRNAHVLDLKMLIKDKEGTYVYQQFLMFLGKELSFGPLSSFNIQEGSIVFLFFRLR
jgi:hypothetical protein